MYIIYLGYCNVTLLPVDSTSEVERNCGVKWTCCQSNSNRKAILGLDLLHVFIILPSYVALRFFNEEITKSLIFSIFLGIQNWYLSCTRLISPCPSPRHRRIPTRHLDFLVPDWLAHAPCSFIPTLWYGYSFKSTLRSFVYSGVWIGTLTFRVRM